MSKSLQDVIVLALSIALTSCGGGGGANTSPTPTVPSQVPVQTIALGVTPTTFNLTRDAEPQGSLSITNLNVVSGYVYPFTWTMTGLPPGLTYDPPSNGGTQAFFSGRASAAGTFPTHVVIRDSSPGQPIKVDTTVTFVVDTTFKFATSYFPPAIQGLPYSFSGYVANGTPPLHFESTLDPLPAGITLDPTSGVISGTSNATPRSLSLGLKVTDSSTPPKVISDAFRFNFNAPLQFSGQTIKWFLNSNFFATLNLVGGAPFFKAKIVNGSLPPGISFADNYSDVRLTGTPTKTGTWVADFQITDSYNPPETVTGTLTFYVNDSPPIIQATFPHTIVGVPYSYQLSAQNGTRPLSWSVTNLPPGLTANSSGLVTGVPTTAGRFQSINISVTDSSLPTSSTSNSGGVILVNPTMLGRNDSIATATTIVPNYGNGDYIFYATLSPYGNALGVAQPDQDFYKVTVAPGATLKIVAEPHYTIGPTYIDPVIEFQDGSAARMNNCRLPGTNTFSAACVNDDIVPGTNHAAQLEWQNTAAFDQVCYVRVLDWSGNARPDFTYTMRVSGAK